MKKGFLSSVVFAVILAAAISSATNGEREKAAVTAAEKWLALVDSGQYSESWREGSGYFRNAVTEDQWEQALRATRAPLGKVISRKLKTASYMTAVPGAPDGQYVVIRFATHFQHKRSALETVTPMLDTDGRWRVSGYYIK